MPESVLPYVGPRPFERQDSLLFFGREQEVSELLSLITAHPVVLMYSPSGAGKTSLVNAGLMPLLESEGFDVLPPTRVRGAGSADNLDGIDNIFVYNTVASWVVGERGSTSLPCMTLPQFLGQRGQSNTNEGDPEPRVLIFDQFEELFTCYADRWTDRKGFFHQVGECLRGDNLLRVVFVMREEYLADMDDFADLLPDKLRIRFRLERLRRAQASEAICNPLGQTGRSFAPGVADRLLDELMTVDVSIGSHTRSLTAEYVEPVQLQVVCQNIWLSLAPNELEIDDSHLVSSGSVDRALTDYYERSLQSAVDATRIREGRLRKWFESELITPELTRGTAYRGQDDTGGIPNAVVELLENLHLVRAELRGGSTWYELTHDRFIEPIVASNNAWLALRSAADAVRKRLEARASAWTASGLSSDGLLDEAGLIEAKRWLDSPECLELGCSDTVLAWMKASETVVDEARSRQQQEIQHALEMAEMERARAEEQVLANMRLRTKSRALALLCIISLLLAGWALLERQHALRSKRVASVQASLAGERAVQAEQAGARAIAAEHRAQLEKHRAEAQATVASLKAAEARRQRIIAQRQAWIAAQRLRINRETIIAADEWDGGRSDQALARYERIRKLCGATGDGAGEVEVMNQIASSFLTDRNVGKALRYARVGRTKAVATRNALEELRCLITMARAHSMNAAHEQAAACYRLAAEKQRLRGKPNAEARLLTDAAYEYSRGKRNMDKAIECWQRAASIYHEGGERAGEVWALLEMASAYEGLDQAKRIECYKRAIVLSRSANDQSSVAKLTVDLAGVYRYDDPARHLLARDCYLEAARIFQHLGLKGFAAQCYYDLADMPSDQSIGLEEQLRLYERAIRLYQDAKDARGEAAAWDSMASCTRYVRNRYGLSADEKDYGQLTIDAYTKAATIYLRLGDMQAFRRTIGFVADLYRNTGRLDDAAQCYKAVLEQAVRLHNKQEQAQALERMAGFYAVPWGDSPAEQRDKSLERYKQALAVYRSMRDSYSAARVLGLIAKRYSTLRRDTEAARYYEEAVQAYGELGDYESQEDLLGDLARHMSKIGNPLDAIRYATQLAGIAHKRDDPLREGRTLAMIGNWKYDLGERVEGESYVAKSLQISKQLGDADGFTNRALALALMCIDRGSYEDAASYYDAAVSAAPGYSPESAAHIASLLGDAFAQSGRPDLSLRYRNQAICQYQTAIRQGSSQAELGNLVRQLQAVAKEWDSAGKHDLAERSERYWSTITELFADSEIAAWDTPLGKGTLQLSTGTSGSQQ